MVDFEPGTVSPMHRVNSLDYIIVVEGVFKMVLDSGDQRMMQRGDTVVKRSTAHRMINVTGDGLLPGRVLVVQLDIEPLQIDYQWKDSYNIVEEAYVQTWRDHRLSSDFESEF